MITPIRLSFTSLQVFLFYSVSFSVSPLPSLLFLSLILSIHMITYFLLGVYFCQLYASANTALSSQTGRQPISPTFSCCLLSRQLSLSLASSQDHSFYEVSASDFSFASLSLLIFSAFSLISASALALASASSLSHFALPASALAMISAATSSYDLFAAQAFSVTLASYSASTFSLASAAILAISAFYLPQPMPFPSLRPHTPPST